MIRLVNVDDLLENIDKEREYLKERGMLGAEHILVHNFRELVENAPIIEERHTGKWLEPYKSHIAYECSNCHRQMPISPEFHFCPICGAWMEALG